MEAMNNNNLVTPTLADVQFTTTEVVNALNAATQYCRKGNTRSSVSEITTVMCYIAAHTREEVIRTFLTNAKALHEKLLAVRNVMQVLDNATEVFKLEMQCVPLAAQICEWEEYMQYSSESGKLYSSMDAVWKQAVTEETPLYKDVVSYLEQL
jgi:hypothetical protein